MSQELSDLKDFAKKELSFSPNLSYLKAKLQGRNPASEKMFFNKENSFWPLLYVKNKKKSLFSFFFFFFLFLCFLFSFWAFIYYHSHVSVTVPIFS